jgi:hypothetical protein
MESSMVSRRTRGVAAAESLVIACLAGAQPPAQAAGVPTSGALEEIVVEAQRIGLVGVARRRAKASRTAA